MANEGRRKLLGAVLLLLLYTCQYVSASAVLPNCKTHDHKEKLFHLERDKCGIIKNNLNRKDPDGDGRCPLIKKKDGQVQYTTTNAEKCMYPCYNRDGKGDFYDGKY